MRVSRAPGEPALRTQDRAGARWRAGLSLGAFIAGLSIGLHTPGAPVGVWFAAAIASCGVAVIFRGALCKGALLLVVLLLGAGWMQGRVHTLAPTRIERLVDGPGLRIVTIEGVVDAAMVRVSAPPGVLDPPRSGPRVGSVKLSLRRGVSEDEWIPLSGRVTLSAPGLRDEHVRAGQRVRVTGRLSPLSPRGSDAWVSARARTSFSAARLSIPDVSLIERVPASGMGGRIAERLRAFRGGVRRRAARALGSGEEVSDARALMLALLLGRREGGIDDIGQSFRNIGAAHLIAISGFHLAVLGSLVLWGVRLTGERGRPGAALAVGLLLAYLFVLPARIPIVRAGVMLIALFASDAIGRRHDRLALLGWVGIGVLVWKPAGVTSLSFILSFGVTALLLWLSTERHPWVFGRPGLRGTIETRASVWHAAWRGVCGAFVVCLLCWLAATPAIVCQTGRVSPIGALASLVLTPVITIDLGIGFVVAVSGAIWPALGQSLSGLADLAGGLSLTLVRALEAVPGSSSATPKLSGLWGAGATLWVIALIRAGKKAGGWKSARLICAGAILLLWLAWQLSVAGDLRRGVVARVDMIDVGDGTCLLVRSGEHALLWDAGSLSRGWGEGQIRDRLGELGVWRVRTAVISHPNLDHYNALPALIEPLDIERVLVGDATLERAERDPRGSLAHALGLLRAQGVTIERIGAGDTITMGAATLRVLADGWGDQSLADNDRSLVVRVEVPTSAGQRRALLTGDIERDAIERLEREGADLQASVLELPHHGSVSEAALGLVGRTGARAVLQSTGDSRGQDPRWDSAREGRVWLETPGRGSVWAEIRADGSIATGSSR